MQERFFLCPCKVWENLKENPKIVLVFLLFLGVVFWVDQYVKDLILEGFRYEGSVISITYVLNDGVAFSMFAFLGEWLKWIQLVLVVGMGYVVLASRDLLCQNYFAFALILGSGASNLFDRFTCGGVVDYIYWHYKFSFAVFNLADVLINLGVGILLLMIIFRKKEI